MQEDDRGQEPGLEDSLGSGPLKKKKVLNFY